jgi:hypothetical protein
LCHPPEADSQDIINLATKKTNSVMPDLIRHPVPAWIPAVGGAVLLLIIYRVVKK